MDLVNNSQKFQHSGQLHQDEEARVIHEVISTEIPQVENRYRKAGHDIVEEPRPQVDPEKTR